MTPPLRILIATDAWKPQTNGVVTAIEEIKKECEKRGYLVEVLHPELGFWGIPAPGDPEVKLPFFAYSKIARMIRDFKPDAVHIASIAVISSHVRKYCLKHKIPFTLSYHSQFPEYLTERVPFIPPSVGYVFMRRFYNAGESTFVSTESMRARLEKYGLKNLKIWPLGVDLERFHPRMRDFSGKNIFADFEKPIWLNVGRLFVEKNVEAFFKLDLPGTKVSIGYGPLMKSLKSTYKDVKFLGPRYGDDLPRAMADADVFVFPSLTDTLGLVNLEALASGTPIAAFPATGPIDILGSSNAGAMDDDLKIACEKALTLSRQGARAHAEIFSWKSSADVFLSLQRYLTPEEKQRLT
jgi:glycosyltransferase involved in cell wall biosynthesis